MRLRYVAFAVASVVTAPLLFAFTLIGGAALGLASSVVAALSRPGRTQETAIITMWCGVALLVGPVLYMTLALLR